MAFSYTCLTLQRVVIPTVLVLAALYRPVGISFVYLLMFFISPFVPVATTRNFKGSVTPYLIILIALSTILLLCHIALQVTIIALKIDTLFGKCSFTEQLFRHIGFIDFRNLNPIAIVEWLAPEVLVFATALTVYLVTKKLTTVKEPGPDQIENGEATTTSSQHPNNGTDAAPGSSNAGESVAPVTATTSTRKVREDRPNFDGLIKISPLFCLATLFFAAVLRPSVPGGFYFLIFLLSGSYWATFQSLQRGFAVVLRFVMVVIVLHTLCIVSYQTPWMQQHLDSKNLIARLIGLEPLVTSSCANDIRVIIYNTSFKLDSFLSPIVLFFSYYALALTTKNLIKPRIIAKPATAFGQQLENGSNKFNRQLSLMTQTSRGSKKDSWTKTQRLNVSLRREHRPMKTESTETTPLVRQTTQKRRTISLSETTGGVAATAGGDNDIPLTSLSVQEEENNASVFDQISYGIVSVGGFIYQNSYIFTNILMMAWSIVYHNWLTFVLLLWANVLWMIPNQRKAMMRSSPFIVIYAELLLVSQYIYGMDLNNNELPSKVDTAGINLSQIGFERPQEHGMQPCVPLIVKTSFVLMFWVTLRQFFKEKTDKRRDSTIADIFAPLQLTVGAVSDRQDGKKTSKFLKKAGDIIKNLLVRLWIWLVVLVIFLCAITGKEMTGFRICYMALFLFFLLVFQSSSKAWVKIMYGFWLFLIFYAMSILILIYTYQFDKFDQYWSDYLNISKTLQTDIGLEKFKTKDLFLHLLSPTLIVILTVIQVHYFHNRFIAALKKPPRVQTHRERSPSISSQRRREARAAPGDGTEPPAETDFPQSVIDLLRAFLKRIKHRSKRILRNFKNAFWRFMELHIIKAVYIAAFVCAISEVCVLHVAFVILCVLGISSRSKVQIFVSRIISFIVTLIILSKMIYQIAYLDHSRHTVTCNGTNETVNDAVWFGLQKATDETGGLMGLLKKYIIYMVMVTLHAVVTLRQFQMRTMFGVQNQPTPKELFPYVTRADAEKNLEGMTKYLLNYGFYRFGIEITFITLVATITFRQDLIAVVYVIWLVILLVFKRSKLGRIWTIFQTFVFISIIVQYIMLVGLPPNLCLIYPWSDSPYSDSIQRWAMLPGSLHYSHVSKLVFDFILLLMINRQHRVFNIEAKMPPNTVYPGGTNKSIVKDIANLGQEPFVNPTRDFLGTVRNYLDVFKNIVFCGFYWISLTVVFLAGTNISDLLALGYLIGAFVFLWQGSDFYLRPIETIIHRWRWLLAYNVLNIVVKTCLQMAGCIFLKELTDNCCWLVHMLGITCASRVDDVLMGYEEPFSTGECPALKTQKVLVWDAICFAFLIFQLRIFKSHYFCHIITDTKANNILASRGAEIIEDLRQKQIEHRQEHEKEVLYKIKRKMEIIRATQQKMLKPIDKPTHFDEIAEIEAVEPTVAAPLARNHSFLSCQGSGYHTPVDEDDQLSQQSTATNNTQSDEEDSGSSSEQLAQHSDRINIEPRIRIECDDFVSDAQTDFADVNSLSDPDDDVVLPARALFINLPLPEAGIRVNLHVSEKSPPIMHSFNIPLNYLKPHTPDSDMNTIPLDGFLDVNRLSMSSAPNSDLVAQLRRDSEESFEVFSPPPYDSLQPPMHTLFPPNASASCSLNVNVSGASSVISSNLTGVEGNFSSRRHRRQSSVNAVSWNETVSIKCTSPKVTTPTAETSEEIPVTLRQKSLHRRHLSMGNASYSVDETAVQNRRRYSNISGAREESYQRSAARPNSWGPVGTAYYLESLMLEVTESTLHGQYYGYPIPASGVRKRKEVQLHPHAVRAGDYYMFEDMDEKFELDVIDDEVDFLEDKNQIAESEKKMERRKTLIHVWKDIQNAEFRRKLYMRQRSYASAPGSRIGIKIDENLDDDEQGGGDDGAGSNEVVGVRTSTHSEPLDCVRRTSSQSFDFTKSDKDLSRPSTSKDAPPSKEPSESKRKMETDSAEIISDKESDEDLESNPIVRLLEAFLVSLTIRLNRFSRNYRYVNKILAEEKKTLKESNNLHRMGRVNATAMFNMMKKKLTSDEEIDSKHSSTHTNLDDASKHNLRFVSESMEPGGQLSNSTVSDSIESSSKAVSEVDQKSSSSGSYKSFSDQEASKRGSSSIKGRKNILVEEKKPHPVKPSKKFQIWKKSSLSKKTSEMGGMSTLRSMSLRKLSDESEGASEPSSSSITRTSNNALNNTDIPPQNNTNLTTTTTSQDQQPPQVPHVVEITEMPLDTVDAKDARQGHGSAVSIGTLQKGRKKSILPEIRIKAPSFDRSYEGSGSLSKQWSYERVDSASQYTYDEEDFITSEHNIIIEVLISSWYALLSNTDLICYIVVFINQVVNASIISLPLPIMVFLWGTLSLPRPTKTFWVTLIAYIQAIVLIKCIFQFKLIWANYINLPNQPLAPAKIFGVELHPHYASYDLLLLLVLFFHRFILKSQGLWKSEYKEDSVQSEYHRQSFDGGQDQEDKKSTDENAMVSANPTTAEREIQIARIVDRDSVASVESDEYLSGLQRLKRAKYMSSLRKFFTNLVYKSRLPTDVYALMFLCDFINFFVLLFGFTAFGSQQTEGDGGVQKYLAENKVPIPFLIMLLVQFILIVIDRALYLRKALVKKIIFHFLSVIGIHIWMFFIVPAVTERSFYSLTPPIVFYIIKCFYMLLSSYQIKCGYPKRILGNFLTKGFSLLNMIAFRIYMLIPFLYELRTILDWVCTDTTMTLFDWLKMEDIFSDIYFIKCSRQMETDFPVPRAQKKVLLSKLLLGGIIILLIVISIWGPLCLFALGNAVGQSNVPYEVGVTIRIGPYNPIYMTNNRESIYAFDEQKYATMQNAYRADRSAITFISGYTAGDVAAVKLAGNSPSLWNISPPDKERLLSDLKNDTNLTARFTYQLTRIPPAKGLIGTVGSEVTVDLNKDFKGREAMIEMLEGRSVEEIVILPQIVPKFIKVLNSGETALVHTLMPPGEDYRPLVIKMRAGGSSNELWWEIRDYCDDIFFTEKLSKLPLSDCEAGIVMYTFNDKKFPSTFSFLTAGGIIGLYTTFVLLASRFLKSFISGQNRKIMFEDLPYVDRVLQLCLDIYLVREALEFSLEEDLFAKLLFLYRSPETMIKWTRPKEEIADDETDTESVLSSLARRREEPQ